MKTTASLTHIMLPLTLAALAAALVACPRQTETASSAPAAKPAPAAAKLGMDEAGALQVSAGDRCPVCAMQVKQHAKFACGMELASGTTFYFCGTGCLLRTWLHPERYVGAGRADIKRMMVKDYFSGEPANAKEVSWIAGSDVVGPMGRAMVPLADPGQLETFKQRHGFKKVFSLEQLDDTLWQELKP